MSIRDLTIGMVGSGGDGVVTMGELIALSAAREGLYTNNVEAYGPQIRGGESSSTVRVSGDPIFTQGDKVDVLVVFNWDDFSRFKGEIQATDDTVILSEAADQSPRKGGDVASGEQVKWIDVPFIQLAKESAGTPLAKNVFTLGLLSEAFGLPQDSLRMAVEHRFSRKKEAVQEANRKAFLAGVEYAQKISEEFSPRRMSWESSEPKLLMSGNEAAAVGAIYAGCRMFAGYPITPSSEILHYLAEWMPRVGGAVVQTEDEMAAIGAVIGASFAGVKAMTATSGPGLALMTEMLGLSSMAEVPVVIYDVQRGGPSTGIPTKSEQSDLWQALWGSHGDAPRVVLAPADVEDCFHTTVDAFNIAEEYQIPVIVLADQWIAQRRVTVPALSLAHDVRSRLTPNAEELEDYKRYRLTETGVSPMTWPGMQQGIYQTNGLEHDEYGQPTSMHLLHEKMSDKRYRKLRLIRENYHYVRRYGPRDAEVGILCWGSSKGPVKEAVRNLNGRGYHVAGFVPQVLYPFPQHELEEFVSRVRELIIIEISYSGQFYKYLRTFLDLPKFHTHIYKRSGGKNLTVEEVEETVRKVLGKEVLI